MAIDKDQPPSTAFSGFSINEDFVRRRYPGLREEESTVLRAMLRERETEGLKRVRTSWPVGEGEAVDAPTEAQRLAAKDQSRWKIDAILDWPGRTEIVELKSRATHTAIGQAAAYSFALADDPDERSTHRLTVAAFRVHPDLPGFAKATGTQLHTVPDADPSTATHRFFSTGRDVL